MLLRLGGHTVSVEGDCAEHFFSQYGGAKPFVANNAEPEWRVRYGMDLAEGRGDVLNRFVFSEIDSDCIFSRSGDEYLYEMLDGNSGQRLVGMRYRADSDCVEATSCANPSALRFSLWFACSMLFAKRRITFVHSSVVVHRDVAVMFLGESGTGKSTHTRLWLENIGEAQLLNDDSPVLAIENGKPYVFGSPWSGKTPCYIARRFQLGAIVRLSQAPQNQIRRLSIPGALAALQPSLPPALMQDEHFADRLIDIVSDTISVVPAYHLACLPNADAAKLSCQTVFGGCDE